MPTLTWLDSFQHQNPNATFYGTAAGVYDTTNTPASLTFVAGRRPGSLALQVAQGGATITRVQKNVAAGNRTIVESFYFRITTIPSANSTLWASNATINAGIQMLTGSGNIRFDAGSAGAGQITVGGNWADSQWHRIDLKWVTSATTYTLDVSIDGVAQTQHVSGATTAADITSSTLGSPSAAHTLTCQYADWVRSVTGADHPIGPHRVDALIPNADGAHNWAGNNMGPDTGGVASSVTTLWQTVDDFATVAGDTTTYIQYANTTNTATEYAEITLPDADADATIWGARAVAAIFSATTVANAATTRIVDGSGSTVLNLYVGDQSDTSLRHQATMVPSITSSTLLNALKFRVGFPTDSNPAPRWSALMIDYASPEAPAEVVNADSNYNGGKLLTGFFEEEDDDDRDFDYQYASLSTVEINASHLEVVVNGTALPATVVGVGAVPAPTTTGEDTLFEIYDPAPWNIAPYFDWQPFDFQTSQSTEMSGMGVESRIAVNFSTTDDFQLAGAQPGDPLNQSSTRFQATNGIPFEVLHHDNDVLVGTASYRAATTTATGSSFVLGIDGFTTNPQNRIFVRFNFATSAYPSTRQALFQWMHGTSITDGPLLKLTANGTIAVVRNDGNVQYTSGMTVPLNDFVRVEFMLQRYDTATFVYQLRCWLDPTSVGTADSDSGVSFIFDTNAQDLDFTQGPALGVINHDTDAWVNPGPHAFWFDDFAISTTSMPAPTGTTPAQGERPSLIASAHTFDQQQFNGLFDWAPAGDLTGDPTSHDIGFYFGIVTAVDGTATPATVVGVGDVPAPTATGTATASPATVVGIGLVPAPTASGNATASPATVVGIGDVPAPTATGGTGTPDAELLGAQPADDYTASLFDWTPFDFQTSQSAELRGVEGTLLPALSTGNEPFASIVGDGTNAVTTAATIFRASGVQAGHPYANDVFVTESSVAFNTANAILGGTDVAGTTKLQNRWFARFDFAFSGLLPAEAPGSQVVATFNNDDNAGAIVLTRGATTLAIVSGDGSTVIAQSTPLTPDWVYRIELVIERSTPTLMYYGVRIFNDPTSTGSPDQSFSGTDPFVNNLHSSGVYIGPSLLPATGGFSSTGFITYWIDDFAEATDTWPTPTGTAPDNHGIRQSLIRNLHLGGEDLAGLFDWSPFDYASDASATHAASQTAETAVQSPVWDTGLMSFEGTPGTTIVTSGDGLGSIGGGNGVYLYSNETFESSASGMFRAGGAGTYARLTLLVSVQPQSVVYGTALFYTTAYRTDQTTGLFAHGPTSGPGFGISNSGGVFQLYDVGTDYNGTTVVPIGRWFRVDWKIERLGNAANQAAFTASIFLDPTSLTPDETLTQNVVASVGSATVVDRPTLGNTTGNATDQGPGAVFMDEARMASIPVTPTLNAPTTKERPSLVANAHPDGSENFVSLFDWEPAGDLSGDPTSHDIGFYFGIVASVDGTATPATVVGVGSVPAPTATGTATASPATVVGIGSVPAPTASGNATAAPATVVGTGSVPPATATGNATAAPATVVGIGLVPAPTALGGAQDAVAMHLGGSENFVSLFDWSSFWYESDAAAFTSNDTAWELSPFNATASPATVVGVGSVPPPTAQGSATAAPATVVGTGTVPPPTVTGTATALPAVVTGVGSVPPPSASGTASTSPATVAGVGTVPPPTSTGAATASPAAVAGVGTVPPATASGSSAAQPATVAGVGSVPPATSTGTATAAPATVAGIGSVPPAAASGGATGTATPGAVQGVGSIPAPTASGNATASAATVPGIGSVPPASAVVFVTAFPATVAGTGSVPPASSTGTATTTPATVAGIGSVGGGAFDGGFDPGFDTGARASGDANAFPTTVAGIGSVPPATATATASAAPATVAGVGTVPPPTTTGTATTTPAVVAGIGDVPPATAVGTSAGTAAPATVAAISTITTPTATGTALTTPATVAGIGSIPPADGRGSATASGATVAGTGSVPPASATGLATALPSVTAGTGSVPPVSASGAATASPATTAALGSVPAPSASGGSVGTATPGAVQGVGSVPAPTILLTATAKPATVAGIGSVPPPTATGGTAATASPATVAGIGRVPAPTAIGGSATTATPTTVQGTATVPAPNVFGEFRAFPATVAAVATIPAPTFTADGTAHPGSVAAIGTVPPPSDVGQIRGEWPQTNGNGDWESSDGDQWPQTNGSSGWSSSGGGEWPQTNDDEWEVVP